MGSIDSYKYPEHDIEQAVEITEVIRYKGISKPDLLAEQLGHSSAEGGAFRNKLTSLRRYGLISGRGDIELTPLAKRIVSPKPNSNEREEAIANAVLNVDLLKELYKKLDYNTPDDDFWFQVVEITDAEREEAKKKSSVVEDLYEAGLKYVERSQEEEPDSSQNDQHETMGNLREDSGTPSRETGIPDEAEAVLITPDAQIDIRSKATYVAAKALFNDIGRKFEQNSRNDEESADSDDTGLEEFL